LDEEMDHIIREAANNHHPAYNDKAWGKMELQLDKHLPQKNDRRRIVFFLLFFLLLGAGTFLVLNNRLGNDKNIVAENNNGSKKEQGAPATEQVAQNPQTVNEPKEVSGNTDENSKNPVTGFSEDKNQTQALAGSESTPQKDNIKNKNGFADDLTDAGDKTGTNRKQKTGTKFKPLTGDKNGKSDFADDLANINDKLSTNRKQKPISKLKPQTEDKNGRNNFTGDLANNNGKPGTDRKQRTSDNFKTKVKISSAKPFEETKTDEDFADNKKSISGKTDSKLKVNISTPGTENAETTPTASVSAESKEKSLAGEETKAGKEPVKDSVKFAEDKKLIVAEKKPVSPSDKKKSESKFRNNFGFSFSAGPDMSYVTLNNTGKTTLTYGAGISYGFAKRFTARAAFYISKKIYEAAPDQYHTPGGNYPNLTGVDANCTVYEIPVNLSYSFGQRKKHNWFGSAGLSSFIMKKEDYVYNYKTPAGQVYTYYNSVSNQNKHYFSVLSLSGGYQYQFNKWLSLQAEPYLKLPLGGVGLGKIKLSSAGVLFTLTIKPFTKSK
jgi:hypothetical protein